MKSRIAIRNIDVYHPDKVVGNEVYLDHFKSIGKDVEALLVGSFGRDKRYVIDSNSEKKETTLTMMIESSKKVLKQGNLEGKDIDLIVAATQVPEYVVPACAVMVHKAIDAGEHTCAFDVNANCASMLLAFQNAYYFMESNPNIKRTLVVGGEYSSAVMQPDNELGNGVFGDAACALILERTDEDSGLVDVDFFSNNKYYNKMLYPICGMSQILDAKREEMLVQIEPFDCEVRKVGRRLNEMLERNNLTVEDVSAFCFSQLLVANVEILRKRLHIPEEKSVYIGDVYGYTGCTSPFICLYETLQRREIKRGDYIAFWTVGAGMQHFFVLIKY